MTLSIDAPASKSMTQRALILGALSPGATVIDKPLVCDDSRHLTTLLRALGCEVTWDDHCATVTSAKLTAPSAPIFCGNAGTAVRFGSCLSLLCESALTIDGDPHMRKRPIGALGDALRTMGVNVAYLESPGCPPLELTRTTDPPREVTVDTSASSQYASGLLMVAPELAHGLTVELGGALVSQPYIRMTVAMMQRAGVKTDWSEPTRIVVPSGGYPAIPRLAVEPDWSGAAFLIAAEELTRIGLEVADLPHADSSLQGDAAFVALVAAIHDGAEELDLTDVPDLIAPLTAVCLFAEQPVRIRGAAHTRIKECDRVAVLCRELRKIGASMTEHPDGIDIAPLQRSGDAEVLLDPEDDHRMAMTFGIVSLRVPGIDVLHPECVTKSFPDFWEKLQTIRERAGQLGNDRRP